MAGLFAVWALAATAVAICQARRLRLIQDATGIHVRGDADPRRQAAAAALRRFADRVEPSAPEAL